jgi:ureidoglycolate lyase
MKLVRWGAAGAERPGLIGDDGRLRDLSAHCGDITPEMLAPDRLARLAALAPTTLPLVTGSPRLGPPVAGIRSLIGIGLNYRDHAAEAGMALPAEPVVFSKHPGALAGPDDRLVLPRHSSKVDWEVELAVIIGSRASCVSEVEALSHIAGYAVVNDISARDWQLEGTGQWIKGKSYPGFAPLGPWLVTADAVPDPQNLRLWLEIDGKRMQDGSTADMVFGVATVVSAVSRFMALEPGDVICTGTPAGVGLGRGVFLKPGDVMTLGVEGLGTQRIEVM